MKAVRLDDFIREMRQNAKSSLQLEAGCRYFDVCVTQKDGRKVFLYELYDDREAFDRHLASEHFLSFNQLTAHWIESRDVQEYIRR
ncbi:antibiotic biosynthesis monooxygenase [Variovorax sp. J22R133]|uniref:putative quinol monooxygenase n=1 Tax=Variovorax brevis TaxID=3053503 RepID=UPI002576583E|nr:antibiotic biosynthesis monooxygenase [Variovorax sp. J22R133]MDM0116426.1 antibiotic biosynthesis monooxygenase [Variovorax sp. J22R133]